MTQEELLKELHTGLIRWYPFQEGARILYLVPEAGNDPLKESREAMRTLPIGIQSFEKLRDEGFNNRHLRG